MAIEPSPWILGARSETGFVRSANEDRMGWVRTDYGDVFIVSDGMGGHKGGALAAGIVVTTLQQQLEAVPPGTDRFTDHVRKAFRAAHQAVQEQRQGDDPETREMGATAVALVTDGARFIVAHVGDSRAYLWRTGALRQLTTDHTSVQRMVDSGVLTPEEAAVHPDASVLDRAIGHQSTVEVDVLDWQALEPDDLLLLCSDGLSGFVGDERIAEVLSAGGEPQVLVDRLIELALATGGHDNVTVQLARYAPERPAAPLLSRTALMVGAGVVLTALVVGGIAWRMTASYRSEIQSLSAAQAASGAASAPTPMASAPLVPSAPAPRVDPPAAPVLPAPGPSQATPGRPPEPTASSPQGGVPKVAPPPPRGSVRSELKKAITERETQPLAGLKVPPKPPEGKGKTAPPPAAASAPSAPASAGAETVAPADTHPSAGASAVRPSRPVGPTQEQ